MRILFLGDSITDCGHCFTPDNLGDGYVKEIARRLQDTPGGRTLRAAPQPPAPAGLQITNGGTDGFTLPRILQKWQQMYRGTVYDTVVIAGGINDVSVACISFPYRTSVLAQSTDALRQLLCGLLQNGVRRILVLEPFLFPVPASRQLWDEALHELQRNIRSIVTEAQIFASVSGHAAKAQCAFHPAAKSEYASVHTDKPQYASDSEYAAKPKCAFNHADKPQCASAPRIQLLAPQTPLDALAADRGLGAVTTDGVHLTKEGHTCLAEYVLKYLLK